MKKNIARILCLIMVLSVVLCGCSEEKNELLGTWTGDMDLSEALNASMALEGSGMEDYFNFTGFTVELTMVFNEDGTYSMSVSEESVSAAFDTIIAQLSDGMTQYIEDLLEAEGLDMTVEEFLELGGISIDDLIAEAFTEEMLTEVVAAFEASGQYKAEGGKLYTSSSVDEAISENAYDSYSISGTTLTIEIVNAGDDELAQYLSSMVLEKVN